MITEKKKSFESFGCEFSTSLGAFEIITFCNFYDNIFAAREITTKDEVRDFLIRFHNVGLNER